MLTEDEKEAERRRRQDAFVAPPHLRHLYARPVGLDDLAWLLALRQREQAQLRVYGVRLETIVSEWDALEAWYTDNPKERPTPPEITAWVYPEPTAPSAADTSAGGEARTAAHARATRQSGKKSRIQTPSEGNLPLFTMASDEDEDHARAG